jgi:hypothetical protein
MKHIFYAMAAIAVITLAAPRAAWAQTDEIQVYDGALAPVGVFNLTVHSNFTPKGVKEPAFPGAVISDKSLNGVPEWAYGVTNWFEAGLYLPLYTIDKNQGALLNGFKLRTLFAVPDADKRRFVYGVNFEFSWNAKHWDTTRVTSEIRPILGWHLPKADIIVNPIFDTSYDGAKNLDFAPSTRVAFNVKPEWQLAIEEYSDYGAVRHFSLSGDNVHQVFFVMDHTAKLMDIEAGVGVGLTASSDKLQLKLILSRDLNKR